MSDAPGDVLGIDPGSGKCGLAVVGPDRTVIHRSIVALPALEDAIRAIIRTYTIRAVVVGDRTGSRPVAQAARSIAGAERVHTVDEHNSTLRARDLYWQLNPPGLFARLIPKGLRVPPGPIDDYAAAVLALDFVRGQAARPGPA